MNRSAKCSWISSSAKGCDVCNGGPCYVVASPLGPISIRICEECALKNRQPWYVLLGGLVGCQKRKVRPSIQSIIDATCEYYGRTENDLWNEMEDVMKEMGSIR